MTYIQGNRALREGVRLNSRIHLAKILLRCGHRLIFAFDQIIHEFSHVIRIARRQHGFLGSRFIQFFIRHTYASRLKIRIVQAWKIFSFLSGLKKLKIIELTI
jgi:hypothetical protein